MDTDYGYFDEAYSRTVPSAARPIPITPRMSARA